MTMAENLIINGGTQSMEVCGDGAHSEAGMNEQPSLLRLPPTEKVVLDVEVCLKPTSTARPSDIKGAVESMLEKRCLTYTDGSIPLTKEEEPYLLEHVHSICLCDSEVQAESGEVLLFWQVSYKVHVYQLNEDGPGEEIQESESIASFQEWLLPAKELHGLWESLLLEKGLKQRLLRYAASALLFADKGVDPHLVSWNRVILLHGPPGSGKTSLCKALAQKLSICFSHRFAQTQLVEVDAHSLFSKWFSESGKLVIKLFQKIHELAEDGSLVFVLLDEVESLAAARQAALSGSEPSDSIRAVNALLTQLDRLKSWSNVVVLTTSNITGAIDLAFVDRADIKVYVGPPSVAARYAILQSCLHELMRVSIISTLPDSQCLLNYEALQARILSRKEADRVARISAREEADDVYDACFELSNHLLSTADACQGLSGRALRKLPFLAHGQVISSGVCPLGQFIEILQKTVLQELAERSLL